MTTTLIWPDDNRLPISAVVWPSDAAFVFLRTSYIIPGLYFRYIRALNIPVIRSYLASSYGNYLKER